MKHGHAPRGKFSPEYRVWASMITRCTNPNSYGWRLYGARGITVCKRWRTFENFLADMGARPAGMSLDRINANRGYFKSNCRWVSPKEQANNKRTTRWVTINGRRMSLSQWIEHLGMKPQTVWARIARGWTSREALLTPTTSEWRKGLPKGTARPRKSR